MKVYCLYNDGDHIACFQTEKEASKEAISRDMRMADIEEEEFDPKCDCKNEHIYLETL